MNAPVTAPTAATSTPSSTAPQPSAIGGGTSAPNPAGGNASVAPAAAAQIAQMFDVVVDGKPMKVSVDDLKKSYGMEKASQQRFNDAAARVKQMEQALRLVQEDPITAIQKLGGDPSVLAQRLLEIAAKKQAEMDQWNRMSPEQRRMMEMEQELNQYKQEKTAAQQEAERRAAQIREQTTLRTVVSTIKEVMKELHLPDTRANNSMVAQILKQAAVDDPSIMEGRTSKVKLKKILENARGNAKKYFEWSTRGYNPEALYNSLPPEAVEGLLKLHLTKRAGLKAGDQGGQQTAVKSGSKPDTRSPAERNLRDPNWKTPRF